MILAMMTRLDQSIRRIRGWMGDHGLELVEAKTEVVILSKNRILGQQLLMFGDALVQTKATVKYLGMVLDIKLTFREHIRRAEEYELEVTV